jgi:hypothetical protein
MKKNLAAAFIAICALIATACKPPEYALYTSPERDFQCKVPWAWNVMYDSEEKHFENLTFIGPFEPDFYLGAPSFSVRWYSRYTTHRLRDDRLEMYAGSDDFIHQILDSVYGPERIMDRPVQELNVGGRKLKYFVVISGGPADPKARWGTALDRLTGKTINPRKHAYVLIDMPSGFYVLAYPATKQGYDLYKEKFDQMVGSFVPLKDGPGGAPLPPPAEHKLADK